MKFECQAYTPDGDTVTEIVEAGDAHDASERLRRKGLFVTSTKEAGEDAGGARSKKNTKGAKVGPAKVAVFARELSVLISTGTPVIEGIMALERQSKDEAWAGVLHEVRMKVEEGAPLSEGMAACPRAFGPVARSLVAAGESSGQLDKMLERLATLMRGQAKARSAIVGALVYPLLLLVISAVVVTVMTVLVLPRFSGLFETLDTPLPPTTKALMSLSEVLRGYWWGIVPALVLGAGGLVFWIKTPGGKRALDTAMLKMPQVGRLVRSFATARVARLLGVLLESKVPLLESLSLTKESMPSEQYRQLIADAERLVTKGESMSSAFGSSDLIAPSVVEAMRNGERTGRLSPVLLNLADYLDDDNETVIKSLSSLLEPVIMIALGVVVGFIAVSMFLPLFDLTASAGGGAH